MSLMLGNLGAFLPDFARARAAGVWGYDMLAAGGPPPRKPGPKPPLQGSVEFVNVDFTYPSRPEARVRRVMCGGKRCSPIDDVVALPGAVPVKFAHSRG